MGGWGQGARSPTSPEGKGARAAGAALHHHGRQTSHHAEVPPPQVRRRGCALSQRCVTARRALAWLRAGPAAADTWHGRLPGCAQGRRPLVPPDMPITAEVREVLDTCRVVAQLGPSSLGAYVISMTKGASDVLAVELLQREAVFQVGVGGGARGQPWGMLCLVAQLLQREAAFQVQDGHGIAAHQRRPHSLCCTAARNSDRGHLLASSRCLWRPPRSRPPRARRWRASWAAALTRTARCAWCRCLRRWRTWTTEGPSSRRCSHCPGEPLSPCD